MPLDLKIKAIDFVKQYHKKKKLPSSSGGRLAITTLCNCSEKEIIAFVKHHFQIGAAYIYLYLDAPQNSYDLSSLEHMNVEIEYCPKKYWDEHFPNIDLDLDTKLGHTYCKSFEKAKQRGDIDWIVNVDADELLYCQEGCDLNSFLAEASSSCSQIRVWPYEAVNIEDGYDSDCVYGARFFRRNMFDSDVISQSFKGKLLSAISYLPGLIEKPVHDLLIHIQKWLRKFFNLMRRAKPIHNPHMFYRAAWNDNHSKFYETKKPLTSTIMRRGFLGHVLGRCITRLDVQIDLFKSHNPSSLTENVMIEEGQNEIILLHYDAPSYEAWKRKAMSRFDGTTKSIRMSVPRNLQFAMCFHA